MRATQNLGFCLLLASTSLFFVACDAGGGGGGLNPGDTSDTVSTANKVDGDEEATPPTQTCEPEATAACVCDNGYLGTKTCAANREGFGGCVCETCAPNCDGKSCGEDGCGGSCGLCFGDDVCKDGTCKLNVNCPVDGTGTLVGDQIKNITFHGANGLPLELHSMCGETKAIWITLVAGWCTACTSLAPTFHGIHEQFADYDVEWLLLVGDDANYSPADWSYAKQYHASKGYPDSWPYVADPGFMGIGTAATIADAQGTFYLPMHIVLAADMTIHFISDETTTEMDAMVALQGLL